jgi:hypothetical protein
VEQECFFITSHQIKSPYLHSFVTIPPFTDSSISIKSTISIQVISVLFYKYFWGRGAVHDWDKVLFGEGGKVAVGEGEWAAVGS